MAQGFGAGDLTWVFCLGHPVLDIGDEQHKLRPEALPRAVLEPLPPLEGLADPIPTPPSGSLWWPGDLTIRETENWWCGLVGGIGGFREPLIALGWGNLGN